MTAAPKQPLVEHVAIAISQWMNCKKLPHPPHWERLQESTRQAYREQAQTALAASHAEELIEALRWYASNEAYETEGRVGDTVYDRLRREVRVLTDRGQRARAVLAKLPAPQTANSGLGYCPICGAAGASREKRPDGNDRCEAGHAYPSREAVMTKLGQRP